MNKSRLLGALSAAVFGLISLSSQAALFDRGGGLIYDDVLDVTWLQNANYAQTSGFDADGQMSWFDAKDWTAGLNYYDTVRDVIYNDWRLPTVSPINGTSFNMTLSSDATTDRGFADSAGWVDGSGNPVSELGYMYYVNLANLGICDPGLPYCTQQTGWGLNNTGLFTNLQSNLYWFGPELNINTVWRIDFSAGEQAPSNKGNLYYAWSVRSGDVRGMTQMDPFLPDPGGGGGIWSFTGALSGSWFDPPAGGYTYTMDGGSLFTDILDFPTGFNSPFEVLVGGISQGSFGPGQQVDFGAGVASFTIQGIDPLVDPDDPSAFPLQLEFNTATADFTMSAVPVPAAFWLFGSGLLGLVGIARRKKA